MSQVRSSSSIMDIITRELPELLQSSVKFSRSGITLQSRRDRMIEAARKRQAEKRMPTDREFALAGPVERGKRSKYAICGFDFDLRPDTWVVGQMAYGRAAEVRGVIERGGIRVAKQVKMSGYE